MYARADWDRPLGKGRAFLSNHATNAWEGFYIIVYIYIYREREREMELIYICIEREKERERANCFPFFRFSCHSRGCERPALKDYVYVLREYAEIGIRDVTLYCTPCRVSSSRAVSTEATCMRAIGLSDSPYIERERKKERELIYIYTGKPPYIYIYIYIYREREREGERGRGNGCVSVYFTACWIEQVG